MMVGVQVLSWGESWYESKSTERGIQVGQHVTIDTSTVSRQRNIIDK